MEGICQLITKDTKTELGKALRIIEGKINLHPALRTGFAALYGYTSDADGIRHAMLESTTLQQEDAQYMLVSCSAFIHYLLVKCEKSGIKI